MLSKKSVITGCELLKLKAYLHQQIDELNVKDVEIHEDSIILVDYYKLKTQGMHEVCVPTAKVFAHKEGNNV